MLFGSPPDAKQRWKHQVKQPADNPLLQPVTSVLKVTSMIKQLLAEEVLKLEFSRPDSVLFNLIPVPLGPDGGEQEGGGGGWLS